MTLFASGYLDRVYSSLKDCEIKEYKNFLKLREQFREGYLDIPYLPTFEEISKEDFDEDDKLISEWEFSYNKEQCNRILKKRTEFFNLEKKYEIVEEDHIEFYVKNLTDEDKIIIYFEMNKIINLESFDLSIEDLKLFFALGKEINEAKRRVNFQLKKENNVFSNVL